MNKLPEWAHENFSIAYVGEDQGEVIRVEPTSYYTKGKASIAAVIDGVHMAYGDLSVLNDEAVADEGVDLLKFQIRLAGTSLYSVSSGEQFEVMDYSAAALMQPKGISKTINSFIGEREISVTLFCDLPTIISRLGLTSSDLPLLLMENAMSEKKEFFYMALPLSSEMLQAAKSLMEFEEEDSMGSLFIEAKGAELLYYFLQGIKSLMKADSPTLRLNKNDISRIHEARAILDRSISESIPFIELAHSLGMNETKLAAGFKHLFGVTMSDYLHGLRMGKANEMLSKTDMSVTHVAMAVGYEYQSNFSNAFKRHFGLTPKEVRRGGR